MSFVAHCIDRWQGRCSHYDRGSALSIRGSLLVGRCPGNVIEDLADHGGFRNVGYHPEYTAASGAERDVDFKYAL